MDMDPHTPGALLATDPAMLAVVRRIEHVAASSVPVLITGESGTGKELVASHLHRCSGRHSGPFVAVDCAALTGSFAAERESQQADRFEAAASGTLLLDEIAEMDCRMQAEILRALRRCEAGGLDARVVATTSRSMQEEVQSGRFRPDLFFRLNVIEIKLPPLRDRPGDIQALANHFARKLAHSHGLQPLEITEAATEMLLRHPWPGNVRELENVIHRAVLTGTGPSITREALELDRATSPAAPAPALSTCGRTIEAVEKDMILDRLRECKGNRAQTATTLGISIRTLRNKLNDYERNGTRIPRPIIVAVA